MGVVDEYLQEFGLTRYQASVASGVSQATLSYANDKPVANMSVKVVKALALATRETPGEALDHLLKLEGNPIIVFIRQHPELDQKLVAEVTNAMIEASENGIKLDNISFNRYYDEDVPDSNQRAEQALKNVVVFLNERIKDLNDD
mgnify:CR=1 FL=1